MRHLHVVLAMSLAVISPVRAQAAKAPCDTTPAYTWFKVDKGAWPKMGNKIASSPASLSGKKYNVVISYEYVVDTLGRVEMCHFRVVKATQDPATPELVEAIRSVVQDWQFEPARKAGRKVRQITSEPMTFIGMGVMK